MPKIAFSDLAVRSLQPGTYFDTKTPAFGLRIGKTRRTWIVLKGAKSVKVRLGHYPALSLAEARKKAHIALGTPYVSIEAPSFTDARKAFLEQCSSRLRPRSFSELKRTLTKHFTWAKTVDKITHQDVTGAIEAIEKPSEANHAFKDIRTFFNWCVPRHLKYSPCTGLKKPHKSQSRSRVLTDEELRAVWIAADECGTPGDIVQLLILTGQRKGEISALRMEWISGDSITLPPQITKNGREHNFPLGKLTLSLLQSIAPPGRLEQSALLFPARGRPDAPFSGWSASKVALDKIARIAPWTLHDLRRTFRTIHAQIGTPPHIGERLVNHISSASDVQQIYDRWKYLPEMKTATEQYETHIAKLLSADPGRSKRP